MPCMQYCLGNVVNKIFKLNDIEYRSKTSAIGLLNHQKLLSALKKSILVVL